MQYCDVAHVIPASWMWLLCWCVCSVISYWCNYIWSVYNICSHCCDTVHGNCRPTEMPVLAWVNLKSVTYLAAVVRRMIKLANFVCQSNRPTKIWCLSCKNRPNLSRLCTLQSGPRQIQVTRYKLPMFVLKKYFAFLQHNSSTVSYLAISS